MGKVRNRCISLYQLLDSYYTPVCLLQYHYTIQFHFVKESFSYNFHYTKFYGFVKKHLSCFSLFSCVVRPVLLVYQTWFPSFMAVFLRIGKNDPVALRGCVQFV